MKAVLIVDIPDEVWKNKEKDLGMYVELWSERIDKDWFGKYYSDSLKPIPPKKEIDIYHKFMRWDEDCDMAHKCGYNCCLEDILFGEE